MSILGAIAAVAALIAILSSIFATFWARPRAMAAVALVASILFPAIAVVGSSIIGFRALESHLTGNIKSITGVVTHMLDAFD
jgi:hypothetical protein